MPALGGLRRFDVKNSQGNPKTQATLGFSMLYRNPGDPEGVMRTELGGLNHGVFQGLPGHPNFLKKKPQIYHFMNRREIITDAVDATDYEWKESSNGTGTPLAIVANGGGAKIITGASSGNYYYYFHPVSAYNGYKPLWFTCTFNIDVVDYTHIFVGICKVLASGDLFENRVDALGFIKSANETSLDNENRIAGAATGGGIVEMSDGVDVTVGMRYGVDRFTAAYYSNDVQILEPAYNISAEYMALCFGVKTTENVAKTMTIKQLALIVER